MHMKGNDWDIINCLYSCQYSLLFVLSYYYSAACMIHSSCLIVYFLCRLKVNHDSHEFILEFGTVANS
jgi:hypothetical protein